MSPKNYSSPIGARRRVDLRLIVGIVLVLASTAGTFLVVMSTNKTVDMYAARATLVPGDPITAEDVVIVSVNLGASRVDYIAPGELEAHAVVTRTIGQGELIPSRALGHISAITSAHIVVNVSGGLPEDIAPGTQLDVWATNVDSYSALPTTSVIVVPGATLVRVMDSDPYALDEGHHVEMLVPRSAIKQLLVAQGDGARLTAVPTVSQAGQ